MRRILVLIAIVAVVGVGGYLFLFKKKDLRNMLDSASGYPPATNAKEAVDLFAKAIKNRDYRQAAKYVTDPFARELDKGADAAKELGEGIDDLTSRMKNDGVITDEIQIILFSFDPFWKELTPAIVKESGSEATATFLFEGLTFRGQDRAFESWRLDLRMMRALSVDFPLPPAKITAKVVKQSDDSWKIAFPASVAQQAATSRLIDRYKDYVNPFKIVSQEIKRDPTTKENVKKRLKELLEEAAQN
ncbi:hypothetical protein [Tuwongella immobilis]|uniref:Uncharacterized protein n=1 Tax=Tuwongella immobilis TaxID=692036 RepID=A0A6C2YMR7_9BACT|nr:hypothetical protein [Tuwongella immobilis]VIP02212.1 unnamed protein product [Tuwongella immobilis]VTS00723.1 unnamed protein product [Tuwongella immobilis]